MDLQGTPTRSRARARARIGRLTVPLAALIAACWACSPALAQGTDPLTGAAVQGAPGHDLQVAGSSLLRANGRIAGADGSIHSYRLRDGYVVQVQVAPEYEGAPVVQRLLATLEGLLHGAEMGRLSVYLASPEGMSRTCGAGATGCYVMSSETMIVPGGDVGSAMPFEMTVTHEYGHHLARNRENEPWFSSYWGPKHWASHEGVCSGIRSGSLYPGTGGHRYWEQPGEAFAQAYAFLHYPHAVPWWWSFGEPDQGAFDAIRADVLDQKTSRARPWRKRLSAGKRRARITVPTPLDGQLRAKLRAPRSARYTLAVRSPEGKVLRRARSKGSRSRLGYTVCGTRSVTLEVRRRSGKGPFKVKIRRP